MTLLTTFFNSKQLVWHEVAHWLGFETEEQVEALRL
jgi:hypothetical protein